jgi:hypothetical protein
MTQAESNAKDEMMTTWKLDTDNDGCDEVLNGDKIEDVVQDVLNRYEIDTLPEGWTVYQIEDETDETMMTQSSWKNEARAINGTKNSHYDLARHAASKGFEVVADSEDNQKSWIARQGDEDFADRIIGEIIGDEDAAIDIFANHLLDDNGNFTAIEISLDGVWAGSGKLIDGRIEDCGAQFCDDSEESENVYELIEEAVVEGKSNLRVKFADDTIRELSWTVTEPS